LERGAQRSHEVGLTVSSSERDGFGGAPDAGETPLYLDAGDPFTRAGLVVQLERQGFRVLDAVDPAVETEHPRIVLTVVDALDEAVVAAVADYARDPSCHVVVVATRLDATAVAAAVAAGARSVARRADATPERLGALVREARDGNGSVPSDLMGSLLLQVRDLQRAVLKPRGLLLNGFSEREVAVLRLLSEGVGTLEIANRLSYSERTVKNIIHGVTERFNLHNRCHAVAFALRAGVI
jgi:DNA-binding NarL/FixJ family response regulator